MAASSSPVGVDEAVAAEWQARLQALKLRRAGLSYQDISIVMAEYHGSGLTARSWRTLLRKAGAPPAPRGSLDGLRRNANRNFAR